VAIRRLFFFVVILGSIAHCQEFDRLCFFDHLSSDATVGSNFSLKVSFHSKPIVGARITLNKSGNRQVVATVKTDPHGIARFRAIAKGNYYPDSPDGLLFRADIVAIKVEAGHNSGEEVEVNWPDHTIDVQTLRGRFDVAEELDGPEIPLRNVELELRDLRTSRLIESTHSDANGDYEFATKDPGVYALRLTMSKKDGADSEYRDLAVEIDPAAAANSIPNLVTVQSDCYGIQFFRRSNSGNDWKQE
jgi:hypothetical protein